MVESNQNNSRAKSHQSWSQNHWFSTDSEQPLELHEIMENENATSLLKIFKIINEMDR